MSHQVSLTYLGQKTSARSLPTQVLAGFGSGRVRLVRQGTAANTDPNSAQPVQFVHHVNAANYNETWMEGMDVYHNPKALNPLRPEMLPGAAHHQLQADGQVVSSVPKWHPFGSVTQIFIDNSED
jgi:hypothetical protein